jgi:hypothetical protein
MNVGKLLVGDVAKPIEAVGNVLDKLFTSDEERLTRQEAMAKLAMQPQLAQVELNKIEAAHRSVFVAGWRPFIGWVCGASLAFPFLINPCIQWYTGQPGPDMPTEALISLVMSLLGMSTLRTFEKVRGVSK